MQIRPQPGPQEIFLSSSADIAIYGGAAGGGKTFAILMEALRHCNNKDFGAVIFRRESTQITSEGGLWDTSETLFLPLGAKGKTSPHHEWVFPTGAKIAFRHLQLDRHAHAYQGAQIPLIGFDELTHFSEKQFWYMLSRNRSTCGVKPYIRATTNPDADSWVAKLIDWWIGEDGYPIMERGGVVRWFVRVDGELIWADSPEDLKKYNQEAKSLTFVPARLEDNQILMQKDPGYLANLQALTRVDRERLLGGNWRVKATAGKVFNRSDIEIVSTLPRMTKIARAWDFAATEDGGDFTAGVKMGIGYDGLIYIMDVYRDQLRASTIKRHVINIATQDGRECRIRYPQDPGQAGKAQAEDYAKALHGFIHRSKPPTGSKLTRAMPFAAAVEAGLVKCLDAKWTEAFLSELHAFTGDSKDTDDQVDAASDAFEEITQNTGGLNASQFD